jgi:hypothetical protein
MARRGQDGNASVLSSVVASVTGGSNNEEARQKLAEIRGSIALWVESDDYKALPRQLKLGVVHLLSETLTTADSPHTRCSCCRRCPLQWTGLEALRDDCLRRFIAAIT